jgi:hypothetical protein
MEDTHGSLCNIGVIDNWQRIILYYPPVSPPSSEPADHLQRNIIPVASDARRNSLDGKLKEHL